MGSMVLRAVDTVSSLCSAKLALHKTAGTLFLFTRQPTSDMSNF